MVNLESFSEKEESILKAAMEVFTEKGFHGAKMQEIADRAGANKALLHYYFRNKERLYSQIFEMVLRKFVQGWAGVFNQERPLKEILRTFIDRFTEVLKQNYHIPLFIANELSQGGKTVGRIIGDFVSTTPDMGPWKIVDLIEQAKKDEEIDEGVDSIQFLLTLMGSCIYFFIAEPIFTQIFMNSEYFDRDQFLEQRKTQIFNTLFYGIQKHGEH